MNPVEDQLLQVTKAIEKQVDSALEQIENLDVNDLEDLRKKRVKELQKLEEKKREWLSNGHGAYEELPEEKCFFDLIKKSENIVLHFYTNSSERCQIMDKHLKLLAPKHIETRFVKLNAEKCPFLTEKLKIKVIPSVVLIQNTIMVDKIIGFTQLGNRDDFTTEVLEWRLAQNGIINYEGDLSTPPDQQVTKKSRSYGKKIRDSAYNRDDEDLDIEEDGLRSDNSKSTFAALNMPTQSNELTAEELAELEALD
ncbi:thioredoxin domain-containing protein 9 [Anthonomus grandis grandis]|uniref:thioredoxin domain-containing protein 9 n=1 Tax=Anthonomus grandis grandis TaxID=2921223 RepID=UPI002164FB9A|nr:thioredoxin domain-containing protein 9 [Anthonomus grandis grandis]